MAETVLQHCIQGGIPLTRKLLSNVSKGLSISRRVHNCRCAKGVDATTGQWQLKLGLGDSQNQKGS